MQADTSACRATASICLAASRTISSSTEPLASLGSGSSWTTLSAGVPSRPARQRRHMIRLAIGLSIFLGRPLHVTPPRTIHRFGSLLSVFGGQVNLTDEIHLDGVRFRYPTPCGRSLSDVTLRLPVGSTVAIVGENGAGKTTLVKLLCRFYEPTTGVISVDGI